MTQTADECGGEDFRLFLSALAWLNRPALRAREMVAEEDFCLAALHFFTVRPSSEFHR